MRFVDVDATKPEAGWTSVCTLHDLLVERRMTTSVAGQPVAVFASYDGALHALHNVDPGAGGSLSAGFVGERDGAATLSSPAGDRVFDLRSGVCLSDRAVTVPTYPVRVRGGMVELGSVRVPLAAAG